MRRIMNRRRDRRVFRHTVDRIKKINVSPTVMRGGIRL